MSVSQASLAVPYASCPVRGKLKVALLKQVDAAIRMETGIVGAGQYTWNTLT